MKNFSRLLILGILVLLLAAIISPLAAQEWEEGGPGEGGVVIDYNLGTDDPATFNILLASDSVSFDVAGWLYPAIFAINPETGLSEPNQPGGMATGWAYDETGTVLTINLREDVTWNDGTPITSADYLYAVNAVRSGQIENSYASAFETMADGTPAGGKIVSVEAPDDFTVMVTFAAPDCIAFEDVNDIPMVPSHVFMELYGEDYATMMDDPRAIPTVSYGVFKDIEFEPGARISLIADQNFAKDAILGYVSPAEWVYLYVPDENVATERFIAGDITLFAVPAARQAEFRENADLQKFPRYEFLANSFTFFAFNHADPANPQSGFDEAGNLIPQTPHPVLGDVRVRKAITMAVNVDDIIEGIRNGNGVKVGTHTTPNSWVFNPDLQYTYDPEAAAVLLEEAGWTDTDGDGVRECHGCKYATEVDSAFEGSPMTLRIRVPAGGVVGEQMGEFFDAELTKIGVDGDYQAIDWGSAFLPELDGQIFDMALLSWGLGLPIDPDVSAFYTPEVDVPGSGFNFGSFYNEEMNQLLADARDPAKTNGCDTEARRELYLKVQQILFDELPYMYLYVPESMTVAQPFLKNWNPTAFSRVYSTDAWIALPSE